jgi:hypothetical protein
MNPVFSDFRKELAVSLLTTEKTDDEYARSVDSKESSGAVEFAGEDLEDNEGK